MYFIEGKERELAMHRIRETKSSAKVSPQILFCPTELQSQTEEKHISAKR